MKFTFLFLFILFHLIGNSQVKFLDSNDRPDLEVQVYRNSKSQKIDTVFILTQHGIKKAVRIIECYDIVYEKTKKHEGKTFYGLPAFFVEKDKHYAEPVKPIAVFETDTIIIRPHNNDIRLFLNN